MCGAGWHTSNVGSGVCSALGRALCRGQQTSLVRQECPGSSLSHVAGSGASPGTARMPVARCSNRSAGGDRQCVLRDDDRAGSDRNGHEVSVRRHHFLTGIDTKPRTGFERLGQVSSDSCGTYITDDRTANSDPVISFRVCDAVRHR